MRCKQSAFTKTTWTLQQKSGEEQSLTEMTQHFISKLKLDFVYISGPIGSTGRKKVNMYLSESKRNDVFAALRYFKKEEMESAILPFYETARNYLTIPELMEFYSLDEITRAEYDIKYTELLQRDIEALWENRLEEMVKEP